LVPDEEGGIFSINIMNNVSFIITAMKLKNLLSQKNLEFCNDVWSVIQYTNRIQMSGICLLTPNVSLKAVLLHKRNKFQYVPLVHAANKKQYYGNM
jgi:hypothetical protein